MKLLMFLFLKTLSEKHEINVGNRVTAKKVIFKKVISLVQLWKNLNREFFFEKYELFLEFGSLNFWAQPMGLIYQF